eukprot:1183501-Prorocentrum_minimum.AAC.5
MVSVFPHQRSREASTNNFRGGGGLKIGGSSRFEVQVGSTTECNILRKTWIIGCLAKEHSVNNRNGNSLCLRRVRNIAAYSRRPPTHARAAG